MYGDGIAVSSRTKLFVNDLDDEALAPEVELARDLLELMEQGADQGDLYGPGW